MDTSSARASGFRRDDRLTVHDMGQRHQHLDHHGHRDDGVRLPGAGRHDDHIYDQHWFPACLAIHYDDNGWRRHRRVDQQH